MSYVYCEGDPVNKLDPSGHDLMEAFLVFVILLIGVIVVSKMIQPGATVRTGPVGYGSRPTFGQNQGAPGTSPHLAAARVQVTPAGRALGKTSHLMGIVAQLQRPTC